MILGTISTVDADNGLQLIIDGEDDPTTKKYTYMASYVPTANDRVLVEEVGGSYVIMGKVISEVVESGIAREATNATNAVNAQVSESCSGNAATATTAESCSGNAATATTAQTANSVSASAPSQSGSLVTNVNRQYNSQIGYYIADITLGYASNFVTK